MRWPQGALRANADVCPATAESSVVAAALTTAADASGERKSGAAWMADCSMDAQEAMREATSGGAGVKQLTLRHLLPLLQLTLHPQAPRRLPRRQPRSSLLVHRSSRAKAGANHEGAPSTTSESPPALFSPTLPLPLSVPLFFSPFLSSTKVLPFGSAQSSPRPALLSPWRADKDPPPPGPVRGVA